MVIKRNRGGNQSPGRSRFSEEANTFPKKKALKPKSKPEYNDTADVLGSLESSTTTSKFENGQQVQGTGGKNSSYDGNFVKLYRSWQPRTTLSKFQIAPLNHSEAEEAKKLNDPVQVKQLRAKFQETLKQFEDELQGILERRGKDNSSTKNDLRSLREERRAFVNQYAILLNNKEFSTERRELSHLDQSIDNYIGAENLAQMVYSGKVDELLNEARKSGSS